MILILVAAIGIAALRTASPNWAAAILDGTVTIVFALLLLAFKRGEPRAFCLTFAVVAAAYLICTSDSWFGRRIEPRLPTSRWLDRAHSAIVIPRMLEKTLPRDRFDESFSEWSAEHPDVSDHAIGEARDSRFILIRWTVPTEKPFRRIGHCLIAVAAAFGCGATAELVTRRMRRAPREAAGDPDETVGAKR
jgi:hypothetical protein